jgi:hypothetical protein
VDWWKSRIQTDLANVTVAFYPGDAIFRTRHPKFVLEKTNFLAVPAVAVVTESHPTVSDPGPEGGEMDHQRLGVRLP